MGIKEEADSDTILYQGRVCHSNISCMSNCMMRRTLSELQHEQNEPTPIFCDNSLAIALSRNYVFHKRSKHIDTQYHFIREWINNNAISVEFRISRNQFADLFTKPLGKVLFELHRKNIGVCKL